LYTTTTIDPVGLDIGQEVSSAPGGRRVAAGIGRVIVMLGKGFSRALPGPDS